MPMATPAPMSMATPTPMATPGAPVAPMSTPTTAATSTSAPTRMASPTSMPAPTQMPMPVVPASPTLMGPAGVPEARASLEVTPPGPSASPSCGSSLTPGGVLAPPEILESSSPGPKAVGRTSTMVMPTGMPMPTLSSSGPRASPSPARAAAPTGRSATEQHAAGPASGGEGADAAAAPVVPKMLTASRVGLPTGLVPPVPSVPSKVKAPSVKTPSPKTPSPPSSRVGLPTGVAMPLPLPAALRMRPSVAEPTAEERGSPTESKRSGASEHRTASVQAAAPLSTSSGRWAVFDRPIERRQTPAPEVSDSARQDARSSAAERSRPPSRSAPSTRVHPPHRPAVDAGPGRHGDWVTLGPMTLESVYEPVTGQIGKLIITVGPVTNAQYAECLRSSREVISPSPRPGATPNGLANACPRTWSGRRWPDGRTVAVFRGAMRGRQTDAMVRTAAFARRQRLGCIPTVSPTRVVTIWWAMFGSGQRSIRVALPRNVRALCGFMEDLTCTPARRMDTSRARRCRRASPIPISVSGACETPERRPDLHEAELEPSRLAHAFI